MVCVKETATFPRLTLVSRLPRVWTAAKGTIALSYISIKNSDNDNYGGQDIQLIWVFFVTFALLLGQKYNRKRAARNAD